MKDILMVGDSICMGYFPIVEQLLGSEANLWMPEGGGRTTRHTLSHIDEWLADRHPDVVHINCGLHDLAQDFDAEIPRVPLAEYRNNVKAILQHLKTLTGAKLFWALTTPVIEKRHHENKGFDRFEKNVMQYNDAAGKVADELSVFVNDLYSVVQRAGPERLLGNDGVHFKEQGYELLGYAVADVLRSALSK